MAEPPAKLAGALAATSTNCIHNLLDLVLKQGFKIHFQKQVEVAVCCLEGADDYRHKDLTFLEVYVPLSCVLDGVDSSEMMISSAAMPIEIHGEVVFLHPVHKYAIIAYDPSVLGSTGASFVRAPGLLPEPELRRGETVHLVDLDSGLWATSRKSVVTNPYAAIKLSSDRVPRYRATNMEFIELDIDFSSTSEEVHADLSCILAGVLTNEHGRVKALWGSFSIMNCSCEGYEEHQIAKGIPIRSLNQVLKEIISGAKGPSLVINGIRRPMPLLRILEVELYPTLLSEARSFGLSNNWIQALVEKDPVRRQVLQVQGCLAGSKAKNLLQQGDMVLAVNKNPITCFNDLDDACHALDLSSDMDDKLKLTMWRQGREIELLVGTDTRDVSGTTHAINWCGCLVQYPHPAARALGFLPKEGHGVYGSMWSYGSLMERFKLAPYQWIVEVNGKQTCDLDTFVDVIKVKDNIRLPWMTRTSTMLSRLGGGASKRKHGADPTGIKRPRVRLSTNVFPHLRMRTLPERPRGILLDRIHRSGLMIKYVTGDGNCQFRSLSKIFHKTQSKYHDLRLQIVDEMRANRQLYIDYGASLKIPELNMSHSEYDDYVARMSRDKTWGDIITLFAATNLYKVRATIISSFVDTPMREVVPVGMRYKKDIYLSYAYFSEDDAHYDALVHPDDVRFLYRSVSPVRHLVRGHFELVVENIPYSWTSDILQDVFEKCWAVANVRVMYRRDGTSRGYGYVEMKYERDLENAVAVMDGWLCDGRRRMQVYKVIENRFDREAAAGM